MDEHESAMAQDEPLKYLIPNFLGHFLPGSFLIFSFFYWTVITIRHYCKSQERGERFESIIWPQAPKRFKIFTSYNFIFVLFLSLDIFALFACFDEEGKFTHLNQLHHIIMFTTFMTHIVVVNVCSRGIWLLPSADYISFFLTFAVNSVIIVNHLDGINQTPLRRQTHLLLAIIVILLSVTILFEAGFRKSLTISVMRSYLVLLQGTWICHIAFMQYRICPGLPEWDEFSHHSKMITVASFAIHSIVDFLITLCFTHCLYRHYKKVKIFSNFHPERQKLLS